MLQIRYLENDYALKYGNDPIDKFNYKIIDEGYQGRSIYFPGKGYKVMPSDDIIGKLENFHYILKLLWEYLNIIIEFDKDSVLELRGYVHTYVSSFCKPNKYFYIGKLIDIIWECKIAGNLIKIPIKVILDANFPLIWFLWYLSWEGIVSIHSWEINDFLNVSILKEPLLLKAIWIETGIISIDKDTKNNIWVNKKIWKSSKILLLNEDNGDVLFWDELLWNITMNTHQFSFFQYLYANIDIFVSHEKIIEHINKPPNKTIDSNALNKSWHASFCSKIKCKLPKKILDFIESPKGGYILKNVWISKAKPKTNTRKK